MSAVTLPYYTAHITALTCGFVPALIGDHSGQQGLGPGPHGAVQRGDEVDEGRRHPAPRRGSVRLRPLPGGSRLGPPQLQTHRLQTQSPLRDDARDQDVRRE